MGGESWSIKIDVRDEVVSSCVTSAQTEDMLHNGEAFRFWHEKASKAISNFRYKGNTVIARFVRNVLQIPAKDDDSGDDPLALCQMRFDSEPDVFSDCVSKCSSMCKGCVKLCYGSFTGAVMPEKPISCMVADCKNVSHKPFTAPEFAKIFGRVYPKRVFTEYQTVMATYNIEEQNRRKKERTESMRKGTFTPTWLARNEDLRIKNSFLPGTLLYETTKTCPACDTPVNYHLEGCSRATCLSCKQPFCWGCGVFKESIAFHRQYQYTKFRSRKNKARIECYEEYREQQDLVNDLKRKPGKGA